MKRIALTFLGTWLLIHAGVTGQRMPVDQFPTRAKCEVVHRAMLDYELAEYAQTCPDRGGFFSCVVRDRYQCVEIQ